MKISSYIISIGATAVGLTTTFAREQLQPYLRRLDVDSNENNEPSIETREVEPGLFSISFTPSTHRNNTKPRKLRPSSEEYKSCILYQEDIYYFIEDEKNIEEKWVCIIENYVSESGPVPAPYAFNLVEGFEKSEQFLNAGVVSGQHVLRWDFAEVVSLDERSSTLTLNFDISEDKNILWIEAIVPNKSVDFEEQDEDEESSGRKLQFLPPFLPPTTGTKKTLVIRIVGDGIGPRPTLRELKTEVFGKGVSLRAQMEKCSHGQLVIEPFSGQTDGQFNQQINGGVVELGISVNPYGKTDKFFENEAMGAAWYVLGDLHQFDLVLVAMPPGLVPKFAAYAYVGSPFSFYSSDAIKNGMIQMHEVGHNLGLQHSGEGSNEYGDASGYMGYSEIEEPRMCYNAVNNYQLDWFSKKSISPTSIDGDGGTFLISGVAGYDPDDTTTYVTLRLVQESLTNDYYIGYNKADGFNAETQEDGDKVIVFSKDGAFDEPATSWKHAALHIGESYVIENFDNSGRSVTVTFSDIDSNAAVVEVTPETSESPTSSPRPSANPTMGPTATASANPSATPTIVATGTTTFWTTTGTTTATTFSGTANVTASVTANMTGNGTLCDPELFLNIYIRTDYFPEETWWKLKMIGGEEVDHTAPTTYESEFTNYTVSFSFLAQAQRQQLEASTLKSLLYASCLVINQIFFLINFHRCLPFFLLHHTSILIA